MYWIRSWNQRKKIFLKWNYFNQYILYLPTTTDTIQLQYNTVQNYIVLHFVHFVLQVDYNCRQMSYNDSTIVLQM